MIGRIVQRYICVYLFSISLSKWYIHALVNVFFIKCLLQCCIKDPWRHPNDAHQDETAEMNPDEA